MTVLPAVVLFESWARRSSVARFAEARPELLSNALEALEVDIPSGYRDFLQRLGPGSAAGFEFNGLLLSDARVGAPGDLVSETLWARQELALSHDRLLIAFGGGTEYFAISTSGPDDPPVEVWVPGITESSEEAEVAWAAFSAMLDEIRTGSP